MAREHIVRRAGGEGQTTVRRGDLIGESILVGADRVVGGGIRQNTAEGGVAAFLCLLAYQIDAQYHHKTRRHAHGSPQPRLPPPALRRGVDTAHDIRKQVLREGSGIGPQGLLHGQQLPVVAAAAGTIPQMGEYGVLFRTGEFPVQQGLDLFLIAVHTHPSFLFGKTAESEKKFPCRRRISRSWRRARLIRDFTVPISSDRACAISS